jgi:hypothetical protein
MNKKIILLLAIFLALAFISSAALQVIVLNLYYSNGNLTLIGNTTKYGFYPDSRYPSEYDNYKLKIISLNNSELFELHFRIPNTIFVDATDKNGTMTGGIIELDNFTFSLTIPYFEDMQSIEIYGENNEKISSFKFKEKEVKSAILLLLIIIALIIVIITIMIKNKHKKKRK